MDDLRNNLTIRELVTNLRNQGIPVTDLDFIQPSNARTIALFKYLLAIFDPTRYALFEQLSSGVTQDIIPTNSISQSSNNLEVTLFKLFQPILESIQFHDFQINDILAPTTHRMMLILNAIVNCSKFIPVTKEIFDTYSEKLEQQTEQLIHYEQEKIKETTRHDWKVQQITHQQNQLLEYEEKNKQILDELMQLKKEADSVLELLETRKAERQKYKDKLSGQQFLVIDAVDQSSIFVENENIDMNEKNKQISLLNQKIEQTMEEYNNKTSSQRQLKNSMDIITILITHIKEAIELKTQIKNMTGEINRMTQSMNAFDKEINNAYEEEAKYIQNISELEIEQSICDEQLEKHKSNMEKFMHTRNQYQESAKIKNVEIEELLNQLRTEETEFREEYNLIKKEHDGIAFTHENLMRKVEAKIEKFQARVQLLYHQQKNNNNFQVYQIAQ